MNGNAPVQKLLILAANPKGTSLLRLDEEVREIETGLQRAQKRDQFILEQKWAVRPSGRQCLGSWEDRISLSLRQGAKIHSDRIPQPRAITLNHSFYNAWRDEQASR